MATDGMGRDVAYLVLKDVAVEHLGADVLVTLELDVDRIVRED